MFPQAIGNRLYELLAEAAGDKFSVLHQIKDDNRKRELRIEDDEEDFLDEGACFGERCHANVSAK